MKVIQKKGLTATVELDGVRRKIRLDLVEKVQLGDYVIVHAGFAIEKLDRKEAKKTLNLVQQLVQEMKK